jgi:hypothetical protein
MIRPTGADRPQCRVKVVPKILSNFRDVVESPIGQMAEFRFT